MEGFLSHPRFRSLGAVLALVMTAAVAGWGIYNGEKKVLALLALVALHLFLRRWHFTDFYLLALVSISLSHVRYGFIQDEFERYKWLALFAMAGLSVLTVILKIGDRPWPVFGHFLALAFLGFAAWSTNWSLHPTLTFQKAGVFGLGMIVAFVGAWSFCSDLPAVRRLLDVHVNWLWMVFPLAVVLAPLGSMYSAGRLRSIFDNANNLGAWTSLSLPLLFGFALTHPERSRRRVALFMLGCALIVAVLCGSRGGLMGGLAGVAVYCLMRWPWRVAAASFAGAVVLFFLVAYEVDFSGISDSLDHLLRLESITTMSSRTVTWQAALWIGAESPWIGQGFGLGDLLLSHYGFDYIVGHGTASLHSSYFQAYVDLGRVGVTLMGSLIGLTIVVGLWTWFGDRHGQLGLTALALTCTLLAAGSHGMVESILLSMGNPWSLPFWVSVALTWRLWSLRGRDGPRPDPEPGAEALPPSLLDTPAARRAAA